MRFALKAAAALAVLAAAGQASATATAASSGATPAGAGSTAVAPAPARSTAVVAPISPAGPTELAPASAASPSPVAPAAAGRPAAATPLPDLQALVRYETRHVMASGITRVDTWQERLLRRDAQVWVERVLPAGRAAPHEDEHVGRVGHAHFDAETSARWLSRGADGEVALKFVDRAHKAVIGVPRTEFGSVGFDGSFEGAASLVPPTVARGMKAEGPAVVGDARWRVARSEGWTHRVLWSESRQLALKVDSQRDDGSVRRLVSVALQPQGAAQPAPWRQLGGYDQKRYDDFMD